MFFKNKHEEVRWEYHANRNPIGKITISINSIRPFKKSFFGMKNPQGCFAFVPNAMEVRGKVHSTEKIKLQFSDVVFLVPEEELSSFVPGDLALLWMSEPGLCFKIEKPS